MTVIVTNGFSPTSLLDFMQISENVNSSYHNWGGVSLCSVQMRSILVQFMRRAKWDLVIIWENEYDNESKEWQTGDKVHTGILFLIVLPSPFFFIVLIASQDDELLVLFLPSLTKH
jgi:hypothetical protein